MATYDDKSFPATDKMNASVFTNVLPLSQMGVHHKA